MSDRGIRLRMKPGEQEPRVRNQHLTRRIDFHVIGQHVTTEEDPRRHGERSPAKCLPQSAADPNRPSLESRITRCFPCCFLGISMTTKSMPEDPQRSEKHLLIGLVAPGGPLTTCGRATRRSRGQPPRGLDWRSSRGDRPGASLLWRSRCQTDENGEGKLLRRRGGRGTIPSLSSTASYA